MKKKILILFDICIDLYIYIQPTINVLNCKEHFGKNTKLNHNE